MQLRWSPAAVEDLFRIIEYIRHEMRPPLNAKRAPTTPRFGIFTWEEGTL